MAARKTPKKKTPINKAAKKATRANGDVQGRYMPDGKAAVVAADGTALPAPPEVAAAEATRVVFGVRPEDLLLAEAAAGVGAGIGAGVEVVEPTGSDTLVFCRMAGQEVCAEFKKRQAFAPGQRLRLRPRPESLHLFDAETGQRLPDRDQSSP